MERLYDQGVVRQLGVSNFYELPRLEALCRNARIMPALIQNSFYAKTHYDRDIRAFCKESGIVYESFWTLTPIRGPRGDRYDRTRREIRAKPGQLFFRYLTQLDIACLTGTSSKDHMEQTCPFSSLA